MATRLKFERRSVASIIAVMTVAAVTLSACSSSGGKSASGTTGSAGSAQTSGASSECVTNAQAFLKPYESLPTTLPSTFVPLSAAPKKGGLIIKLAQGAVAADVLSAQAQAQAAAAIGWTGKMISYDGSVADLNEKFHQALQAHPTVISVASADPQAIKQDLVDAKAAGVIVSISGSPNDQPSGYPGYSAGSFGIDVFDQEGDMMTNWALEDSQCKANVAVVTLAGISTQQHLAKHIASKLASACSSCSSTQIDVQATDLGSPQITNAIVSALQANPKINYLLATLGNITDGLQSALKLAGISNVKIVSVVPDTDTMKGLQTGFISMSVDLSVVMNGWVELAAGLASLDTKSSAFVKGFPLAILTPQNVSKTSTEIPTYPTNYPDLFKALWKISS